MATFVLIPGAGGEAWYWHRLVPLLEEAGHHAIAVDLLADDPKQGFEAYAKRVARAIGRRRSPVIVAQSMGGFTAALVCERVRVGRLVFVNAMIPLPGERFGEWWSATRSNEARLEAARRGGWSPRFEEATYFLHDVPPGVLATAPKPRTQTDRVFVEACNFERWPDVATHVLAGRDDRFFPLAFQRRIARERLGLRVDAIRGGHLVALSNPKGLAARLIAYAA